MISFSSPPPVSGLSGNVVDVHFERHRRATLNELHLLADGIGHMSHAYWSSLRAGRRSLSPEEMFWLSHRRQEVSDTLIAVLKALEKPGTQVVDLMPLVSDIARERVMPLYRAGGLPSFADLPPLGAAPPGQESEHTCTPGELAALEALRRLAALGSIDALATVQCRAAASQMPEGLAAEAAFERAAQFNWLISALTCREFGAHCIDLVRAEDPEAAFRAPHDPLARLPRLPLNEDRARRFASGRQFGLAELRFLIRRLTADPTAILILPQTSAAQEQAAVSACHMWAFHMDKKLVRLMERPYAVASATSWEDGYQTAHALAVPELRAAAETLQRYLDRESRRQGRTTVAAALSAWVERASGQMDGTQAILENTIAPILRKAAPPRKFQLRVVGRSV